MDLKDRKTQVTIGVVVLLLIIAGWYFLGGKSEPASYLTEIAGDPVEAIIGRDLLIALEKMRAVTLDVSLFNDSSYKSLQDTTVIVPTQPIGRHNPFAPFGQ